MLQIINFIHDVDPVSTDVPKELSLQPSSVVSIPSTVTVTAAACPTKTEIECE